MAVASDHATILNMLELSPHSVIFGGSKGNSAVNPAVNPAGNLQSHPLGDPALLAQHLRVKGMKVLEVDWHPLLRLFFRWPEPLKKLQEWVQTRALTQALVQVQKMQKLHRPIVWAYEPVPLVVVQALRPTRLILYVASEKAFDTEREAWLNLAQHAHLILSSRPAVLDRFPAERVAADRAPDGLAKMHLERPLDLDFFAQARGLKGDEPEALQNIPYPRIAVWSGLEEHELDSTALLDSARARPDLHWIVIQTSAASNPKLAALALEPNIHVVSASMDAAGAGGASNRGAIPVPEILKFCNVVAVPYPEGTKKVYDTKIYEGMAAGKPVVTRMSKPIEELQRFVYGYSTGPELLIQVERALKNGVLHPDWCDDLVQTRTLQSQLMRVLGGAR
jgi:hypothetical protein